MSEIIGTTQRIEKIEKSSIAKYSENFDYLEKLLTELSNQRLEALGINDNIIKDEPAEAKNWGTFRRVYYRKGEETRIIYFGLRSKCSGMTGDSYTYYPNNCIYLSEIDYCPETESEVSKRCRESC